MTQTAKRLVFLNLVLSVVFLAWAVGLYTNEVPWHNPPPGDGPKVEGMVAQLQARIKTVTEARDPADQRWGETYQVVQTTEGDRVKSQKYYADLLRSVRTGDLASIKPPVQELAFVGPTVDITKLNGRPPVTINGESVLSIAGYHARIQQTIKDYQTAQATIDELGKETKALTEQINGLPVPPPAATAADKGLRRQIREHQELVHGLQLEQQYLRSPLTYYTLQREQLRQRQAALAGRLGELKPAVTASAR